MSWLIDFSLFICTPQTVSPRKLPFGCEIKACLCETAVNPCKHETWHESISESDHLGASGSERVGLGWVLGGLGVAVLFVLYQGLGGKGWRPPGSPHLRKASSKPKPRSLSKVGCLFVMIFQLVVLIVWSVHSIQAFCISEFCSGSDDRNAQSEGPWTLWV